MKRRTFLKCMGGTVAALLVSETPVLSRLLKLTAAPASRLDRSGHRMLHGRDGGCSAPGVADDGDVALENGLLELDRRVI